MKTCTRCNEAKPLDQFHRDKRRVSGREARCKACKTELHRAYRKANGYDRKRYQKNPQGERERHLVRKYGVTLADYDAMFASQGGKCAICGRVQVRALDVDHCHVTGKVRGLLCTNCNRMIGHAGDSAECLEAAAVYLRGPVPQVAAEFVSAFMEVQS